MCDSWPSSRICVWQLLRQALLGRLPGTATARWWIVAFPLADFAMLLSNSGAVAKPSQTAVCPAGAGQPGKAREVAQRKGTFVAASKEDQASAAEKYPESQVLWRR